MRFLSWHGEEECQECLKDAIAKNIPAIKRAQQCEMLPCSKHGHPAWISSRLLAWGAFFKVIEPYCQQGRLDHVLISKICDAYGLDFLEAFEKLTWIASIVMEVEHGNKRV